jgi:hypothetical protein
MLKQLSKSDSKSGNENSIDMFEQENTKTKDLIKAGQLKSQLKKHVANKHIYTALNYYNNTNLESILYEKDADISRGNRFAKSIKKFPAVINQDKQNLVHK